jgi:nucleotide-binding universal stress UspA family protein
MKTILASLTGYGNDHSLLETTFAAGKLFSSHVTCFFVKPDFPSAGQLAHSGIFVRRGLLSAQLADSEREGADRQEKALQAFAEFRKLHKPVMIDTPPYLSAASYAWHVANGSDIPETIDAGRFHELVVLGRQSVHEIVEVDRAGTIAMSCGRPVLLAPPSARAILGDTVAIAWKNKPEAARALTAAAPFLEKAKKIFVLTVCEGTAEEDTTRQSGVRLAEHLKWNGYTVEARHVKFTPQPASMSLLNETYACDADLLVMGAYGHNRLRELVFGGVTRDLTNEAAVPILMFH